MYIIGRMVHEKIIVIYSTVYIFSFSLWLVFFFSASHVNMRGSPQRNMNLAACIVILDLTFLT